MSHSKNYQTQGLLGFLGTHRLVRSDWWVGRRPLDLRLVVIQVGESGGTELLTLGYNAVSKFSSVQSLSCVQFFSTVWTAEYRFPVHQIERIRSVSAIPQPFLTLCDPIGCSLPGFSVH